MSLIIQRDLNDPKIGFVTITRTEVSPDLKNATVYFTTIEKDKSFEDTVDGLNRSAGFVRKLIGDRMRIKYTPKIVFAYDQAQDSSNRIDEIIEMIHKKEGTS